jgi:hypothetical protein
MGCGKSIEVDIPKGFSYKTITVKCGSTGIDGYPNLCEECEKKKQKESPSGDWRYDYKNACIENGENFDEEY